MSRLSRVKGRTYEQRIARELRAAMPDATVRRSQQAHRAYEPDLVIEGDAPAIARRLWLELTDSRAPSPLDKLAQAERDTAGHTRPPCPLCLVVWHRTGAKSIQVTARLGVLCEVLGGEPTPVEGWLGVPVTVDWQQVLGRLRGLAAVTERGPR